VLPKTLERMLICCRSIKNFCWIYYFFRTLWVCKDLCIFTTWWTNA